MEFKKQAIINKYNRYSVVKMDYDKDIWFAFNQYPGRWNPVHQNWIFKGPVHLENIINILKNHGYTVIIDECRLIIKR